MGCWLRSWELGRMFLGKICEVSWGALLPAPQVPFGCFPPGEACPGSAVCIHACCRDGCAWWLSRRDTLPSIHVVWVSWGTSSLLVAQCTAYLGTPGGGAVFGLQLLGLFSCHPFPYPAVRGFTAATSKPLWDLLCPACVTLLTYVPLSQDQGLEGRLLFVWVSGAMLPLESVVPLWLPYEYFALWASLLTQFLKENPPE